MEDPDHNDVSFGACLTAKFQETRDRLYDFDKKEIKECVQETREKVIHEVQQTLNGKNEVAESTPEQIEPNKIEESCKENCEKVIQISPKNDLDGVEDDIPKNGLEAVEDIPEAEQKNGVVESTPEKAEPIKIEECIQESCQKVVQISPKKDLDGVKDIPEAEQKNGIVESAPEKTEPIRIEECIQESCEKVIQITPKIDLAGVEDNIPKNDLKAVEDIPEAEKKGLEDEDITTKVQRLLNGKNEVVESTRKSNESTSEKKEPMESEECIQESCEKVIQNTPKNDFVGVEGNIPKNDLKAEQKGLEDEDITTKVQRLLDGKNEVVESTLEKTEPMEIEECIQESCETVIQNTPTNADNIPKNVLEALEDIPESEQKASLDTTKNGLEKEVGDFKEIEHKHPQMCTEQSTPEKTEPMKSEDCIQESCEKVIQNTPKNDLNVVEDNIPKNDFKTNEDIPEEKPQASHNTPEHGLKEAENKNGLEEEVESTPEQTEPMEIEECIQEKVLQNTPKSNLDKVEDNVPKEEAIEDIPEAEQKDSEMSTEDVQQNFNGNKKVVESSPDTIEPLKNGDDLVGSSNGQNGYEENNFANGSEESSGKDNEMADLKQEVASITDTPNRKSGRRQVDDPEVEPSPKKRRPARTAQEKLKSWGKPSSPTFEIQEDSDNLIENKNLVLRNTVEKSPHSRIWEEFVNFCRYKKTECPKPMPHDGRRKAMKIEKIADGNYDDVFTTSWNPYKSNKKQASFFLSLVKFHCRFEEHEKYVKFYVKIILTYLKHLKPRDIQWHKDVKFPPELLQAITSPTISLNPGISYDVWSEFVCWSEDKKKLDPFLTAANHVREFIIEQFMDCENPKNVLDPYPHFYQDNTIKICRNLGFYIKTDYEDKPLLESPCIQSLLTICEALDERLDAPLEKCNKETTDLLMKLTPKYWLWKYKSESHREEFWNHGLIQQIMWDVKNKVLTEHAAAWQLGVTVEMISRAVYLMEVQWGFGERKRRKGEIKKKNEDSIMWFGMEFTLLTVQEYLDRGYGEEENFWEEPITQMLIEDVRNRVRDLDTLAFQLGTSAARVMRQAGRIKTVVEVAEETFAKREEEINNKKNRIEATKPLNPLEQYIKMAEKNEDKLSEYEKVRLQNMRERQKLLASLNFAQEKNAIIESLPQKTSSPVKTPKFDDLRDKSSRIKRKSTKITKLDEDIVNFRSKRQSPLWVGVKTPHATSIRGESLMATTFMLPEEEIAARIPVPKLTLDSTELIQRNNQETSRKEDYQQAKRFMQRLTHEIEEYVDEEKRECEVSFGDMKAVVVRRVSNQKLSSLDMAGECIVAGDMAGGLGLYVGGRSLSFRPHNMAVSRTLFLGSGMNTKIVSASHDGTVRLFDLAKEQFEIVYSWNKQYRSKQGVTWLEKVDDDNWLIATEEGDLLQLDKRMRHQSTVKLLNFPVSKRSCNEEFIGKQYKKQNIEDFATPALVGSNISIHPVDKNLMSLCNGETVQIYDRRHCQKALSTITTSYIFEPSSRNSAVNYHAGAGWSNFSGSHFATCQRKQSGLYEGILNLFTSAQLRANQMAGLSLEANSWPKENTDSTPQKSRKYKPDLMFTTSQGVTWSPWNENICYVLASKRHTAQRNVISDMTMNGSYIVGLDVTKSEVVMELGLPNYTNLIGCHPSKKEVVVANLTEPGDITIYK